MTIREIHKRYFHTKSITKHKDAEGFKLWTDCELCNIPTINDIDTYSSIFILWDADYLIHQDKFFDDIVESLKVLNCGNRLFFEHISEGIVSYMFEKFKNEITDFGISIIHIENVGYIIARPTDGSLKMYNTYSLDEYLKKMDEYVVCGIAKNEDDYIEDWVRFHLRIGFDHIYLYDNNAPDKAKYADILKQYIDAGADAIIGSHAHVLQGIEFYKNKPIIYNLGDFIFNSESKETGIFQIKLLNDGNMNYKFIPAYQSNEYTKILYNDEKQKVINNMNSWSINAIIDNDGIIKEK